MAVGKKINPIFKIDSNIELFFKNVYGDEARYTQIFLNFLSNAFKFTPDNGNISIEIRPYGDHFSHEIRDKSKIEEITRNLDKKYLNGGKNSSLLSNNFQGSVRNLSKLEAKEVGSLYYVAF